MNDQRRTPAIQRKTVALPPALVMFSQIFFTLLFGWLGLLIATSIVALLIVVVRMAYVESFLGDEVKKSNEDS